MRACVVSTFDMVNIADLDLLRQVSDRCDEMVVMVLGDKLVEALHGRPAVVPASERLELVRSLRVTEQVQLCTDLADIPGGGVAVYTDEERLAGHAHHVLVPARRSSSRQLRHALAHGSAAEGHVA